MIGLRLHNYEVVSLLGEGGMGTVYLARHTYMGRRAAIKFLRPELLHDKSVVARFLDESRATNAIQHPNIIDIIDVGMLPDGRTPYLMMEFLDGESLALRLERSRPLPIAEAVEIACQTASALAAAHARQIVHRDLKPDNLFLLPDQTLPSGTRVKVLDFGIAKLRSDLRGGSVRTQTGVIMGTPQYMSPEQCRGFSDAIDHRTDIYALGIILYEMLSGQAPFVSECMGDIIMRHMSEAPPPLHTRVPEIPESLERAVLRALAKQREDRFDSMADFARAIRQVEPEAQPAGRARADWSGAAATLPAVGTTPAPVPVDTVVPVVEPAWITQPALVGARTTLSDATGQMLSGTERTTRAQRRRGLIIGVAVVGVLAAAGLVAGLLLRSPSPAAVSPRSAPASAAVPGRVAAPALAPAPAAPTAEPVPALAPRAASSPVSPVALPVAERVAPAPSASQPTATHGKKGAKRRVKSATAVASPLSQPGNAQVSPSAPPPAPIPVPVPAPSTGHRGGRKW